MSPISGLGLSYVETVIVESSKPWMPAELLS